MARRPAQETDATQSSAPRTSPAAAIRHRLPGGLTFSRLTLTIVSANLIGLIILMLGSLGMTQYRDGLVAAKLEGVRAQAQVIADIMAQVAADDTACDESVVAQTNLTPGCAVALREDAVNLVFSRVWDSFEGRVRVFNAPRDYDALMGGDPRELLLEDVVLHHHAPVRLGDGGVHVDLRQVERRHSEEPRLQEPLVVHPADSGRAR